MNKNNNSNFTRKILLFFAALFAMNAMATEGALNGVFSINAAGDRIQFASGNLTFCWYYGDYHFAEHQWDIIGADNTNIGQTAYEGSIDLFGWGTYGFSDGVSNEVKHTTSSEDYATFSDWGQAVESMDLDGTWRTLTKAEWDYILATRANAASLYAKATVCGVKGMILLPDNWDLTAKPLATTPIGYDSNVFDAAAWSAWETAGAVFLPDAGYRTGTTVNATRTEGNYWTSTEYESDSRDAYQLYIPDGTNEIKIGHDRKYRGMAVRLVKEVVFHKVTIETEHCDVTVEPSGINLDSVPEGTILHLTAVPTDSYRFKEWENYDPAIGLIVKSDTTVTARCAKLWIVTIANVTGGHAEVSYASTGVKLTEEELQAVPDGTKLIFNAVPDEGYRFVEWTPNSAYGFTPTAVQGQQFINRDFTVTPVFRKNGVYGINIEERPGGTVVCTTPGVKLDSIPSGTVLTFKATPNEGYIVNRWTFSGPSDLEADYEEGGKNATMTVTADGSISCYFDVIPTYTVTFSAAPSPSLAPSPARRAPMAFGGGHVECVTVPTSGEPREILSGSNVEHGTVLRFTAVPDALGWTLDYWSTGPATGNSKEVTIDNDYTIVAYFKEAETYSLTMQDDGNGVVTIFNGTPGEEVYTTAAVPVIEGTPIILTAHPNIGYEFDHWDNYTAPVWDEDAEDWIVPTMTGNLTVKAYFRPKATETLAEGELPGLFTVGKDDEGNPIRVRFSKGNLQYIAGDGKTHTTAEGQAQGTWQFAESQEEYIGSNNSRAAEDYNQPIDLFNYGTSGYEGRQPWLQETDTLGFDISETNYDWGVYNAISNGGNQPGMWRTLTQDEWIMLLYNRNTYTHYYGYGRQLQGLGKVMGEAGLLLMPDGWVMPGELAKENVTFLPLETGSFDVNRYKGETWALLEASGVVFFPAGGARIYAAGFAEIMMVGSYGALFSSTIIDGTRDALCAIFGTPFADFEGGTEIVAAPTGGDHEVTACSVRLVRDVPMPATGLEDVQSDNVQCTKVIRDGQLYIMRDGKTYNAQGIRIK